MSWDLNKNNEPLVELEHIIKELSEEKDIPYKEMEEICVLSLEYIKELTSKKDTLSILIPYVGTLYYSERLGESWKQRLKRVPEWVSFLEYRNNLVREKEEEYEVKKSYHRKKPFLYKFKNLYKKMFGKIVKGGATANPQALWTEFAAIQNKIQEDE